MPAPAPSPLPPHRGPLTRHAGIVAFYGRQARLIWEWRADRLSLVRRSVLTLLGSVLALKIITFVSADLVLDGNGPLLEAAVFLTILNSLARPILIWLLSPFPGVAVQIVGLIFQVVVVAGLGRFVPGVHVGGGLAPLRDAILLTVLNAIFAEVMRTSDDRSIFGNQVRRLAATGPKGPVAAGPGMLVVQIDGLSLPVLQAEMRAGRMPFLASLFRDRILTLTPWHPLLPPVTPASQAGILHGNNDDIPGFRWYEKLTGRLLIANEPADAAEIVKRRSNGTGLLVDNGASIGNLVTGDAPRSYLTMATVGHSGGPPDDPRALHGLFVSQMNYLRIAVLTVGEVLKELYQAERQSSLAIEPRMHRNLMYALERALTNVALRDLSTALVIEEMYTGTPAIYVDYTSYDAVAHHVGPERAEAADSLEGIDEAISILMQATRDAPRPYRLVVLSDHGQSLGATFRQRYGQLLEDVVRSMLGETSTLHWAPEWPDFSGGGRMLLAELGRGRGVRRAVLRRAADRSWRRATRRVGWPTPGSAPGPTTGPATGSTPDPTTTPATAAAEGEAAPEVPADGEKPAGKPLEPEFGLVGCASGNLALLYFTFKPDRVTMEELEDRHPGLIDSLIHHPGIGIVLVRSAKDGPLVIGAKGRIRLRDGVVEGDDPLAPYGEYARAALTRLDGFTNTGDLAVISPIDPVTGEVLSYEELIGSHGGLGGWQQEPFLMHPTDWKPRSKTLVGAPALYAELRGWLVDLGKPASPAGDGHAR